jgi:hypothetical protein
VSAAVLAVAVLGVLGELQQMGVLVLLIKVMLAAKAILLKEEEVVALAQ